MADALRGGFSGGLLLEAVGCLPCGIPFGRAAAPGADDGFMDRILATGPEELACQEGSQPSVTVPTGSCSRKTGSAHSCN